jgi:prepilin-type N-terminal cleavage/methylation domain-containing protein
MCVHPRPRPRAFTLIELLVVVAIIALLIAILLPSLGRAKDSATTTKCAVNVRALYQANSLYAAEWEGSFSPYKTNSVAGTTGQANSYWYGPQLLGAQLGKNAGLAGGGSAGYNNYGKAATAQLAGTLLHCPADPTPGNVYATQAPWINTGAVTDYSYNTNFGDATKAPPIYRKVVKMPRTTLMFMETHWGTEKGDKDWYFSSLSDIFSVPTGGATAVNRGTTMLAYNAHKYGKASNMVFADGSIVSDDIFKLNTTNGAQVGPNAVGTDKYYINPFSTGVPEGSFPYADK